MIERVSLFTAAQIPVDFHEVLVAKMIHNMSHLIHLSLGDKCAITFESTL